MTRTVKGLARRALWMASREEKTTLISCRSAREGFSPSLLSLGDLVKDVTGPKTWSLFKTAVDSPNVTGEGEMMTRAVRF